MVVQFFINKLKIFPVAKNYLNFFDINKFKSFKGTMFTLNFTLVNG